ncbi:MAG TPA: substrate-binding domain-containing protein [Candidatus Dormibacteraeota bacterium]
MAEQGRGGRRRSADPGAVEAGRRLRLARMAAGLSQSQLAETCGVSRQAIAGAEAGVWSPSLAVALQLARALGATVDQLFATGAKGRPVAATALAPGDPGARARITRVWDRWVSLPLARDRALVAGFAPASGVLGAVAGSAQLWGAGRSLVVAGCDPALPLLAGPIAAAGEGWSLDWWSCGSDVARRLLGDGLVHAAAVHYPTSLPQPRRRQPSARRLGFARWREGLVLRPGQKGRVRSVADAIRLGLVWVNREPGAEARRLLDQQLELLGCRPPSVPGYRVEASGHLQVASLVSCRAADVGVATEPAALAFGLDFIPLSEEECALLVAPERLDTPELRLLLTVLAGPQLRRELDALPGYDPTIAGAEL